MVVGLFSSLLRPELLSHNHICHNYIGHNYYGRGPLLFFIAFLPVPFEYSGKHALSIGATLKKKVRCRVDDVMRAAMDGIGLPIPSPPVRASRHTDYQQGELPAAARYKAHTPMPTSARVRLHSRRF